MNRDQFISYLHSPDKLGAGDAVELEHIVKEFPYFQTAQLLYVKALHNQNSIHYNNQLKSTAVYAGDRKMLYRLINHKPKEYVQEVKEVVDPVKPIAPIVSEEPKTAIDERKHFEVKVIPRVVVLDPTKNLSPLEGEFIKSAIDGTIEIAVSDTTKPADYIFDDVSDDEPQINNDVAPEVYSFSEWLKVMKSKSPQSAQVENLSISTKSSNADNTKVSPKRKQVDSLIDKFIKEEPRITKPKSDFYKSGNMAKQSVSEDDGLVTETLAKLYIKQGHYPKAVRSYLRLIELYPAKEPYYQQQIEYVRALQNGK